MTKDSLNQQSQPTSQFANLAELGHRLGFASTMGLLENSISVSTDDGKCWYVTSDGKEHWSAWNENDLQLFGPYASDDDALVKAREQAAASSHSTDEPGRHRDVVDPGEHRDVVDEASWESFPASDPPAW